MTTRKKSTTSPSTKQPNNPQSSGADLQVIDEERRNFTIIPNMIDDMGLSVFAVRLYLRLKRRAGENGACWENTDNLAAACKIGKGSISRAKRELAEAGLILVEKVMREHGEFAYDKIRIVDIWKRNGEKFTCSPGEQDRSPGEQDRSPGEQDRSPGEQDRSPGDLKEDPSMNKNQPNNISPAGAKPPIIAFPFSTRGGWLLGQYIEQEDPDCKPGFPSKECKRKFEEAEGRIGVAELEKAISHAVTKGIGTVSQITNYVAKWKPQPNNEGSGNGKSVEQMLLEAGYTIR